MSYLVLARKWRPQRFSDLVGQDVIVRTLKNALSSEHTAHAYLMTGIRGVGKTTISRLMAMAINCDAAVDAEPCGACESCASIAQGNNLDVQEMDAASHTGVDDIREILDGVRYPPVSLKAKVYIIDEAHMLSKSAFNALLKTLEEPPERVMFILATTESDKLPVTVRSRCQRFDLRRLHGHEISDYLSFVLKEEGISAADDALQVIARAADGSVRDALSLTERVLAFSNQAISLSDVQQSLGLIGAEQTQLLADAVLAGDAQAALSMLRQARQQGVSPTLLLQSFSERLHEMMCCKIDPTLVPQGVNSQTQAWLLAQSECWSNQALDLRYQILIHGLRDIQLVDEQSGAEMIAMRLAHVCSVSPAEKALNPSKATAKPLSEESTEKKTLENAPIAPQQDSARDIPTPPSPATIQHPDSEPITISPQQESTPHTPTPPSSWEQAMLAYHNIKPGIAAILEHVICQSFEPELCLVLDKHQQHSLAQTERNAFQIWLNRDIQWINQTNETGESLLDKQQRENQESTRQMWQHAEQDPNVLAVKEAFDCQLVDVKSASFTDTN
ncbi:MAG: DNA polymerase III subunit gamma/tau [Ghiorsea sp.]